MQIGEAGDRLSSTLERLASWGSSRSWVGPDPYEGLNSPLGRIAPGRRGRQAVTQAYKRLPLAPAWPLSAAPRPNAKALALALSGYATPAGRELPSAGRFLAELPSRLDELNLARDGYAWGYPFDVQTRRIRYAPTTPNAIVTCFVVDGLLDAHAATDDVRCLEMALGARATLMSLGQSGRAPYFAYVPVGADLIHNANLLVCGTLARLEELDPDRTASDAIRAATTTTVEAQRRDGLWPYGEAPGFEWVDNFHTAYTLDGLQRVERVLGGVSESVERGLSGWRESFVHEDGWTPYYKGRRYPLETHCAASAIDLLCTTGFREDALRAQAVAERAIAELWIEDDSRFAFRRTERGLNRREFMRWTNAPMFKALAALSSLDATLEPPLATA